MTHSPFTQEWCSLASPVHQDLGWDAPLFPAVSPTRKALAGVLSLTIPVAVSWAWYRMPQRKEIIRQFVVMELRDDDLAPPGEAGKAGPSRSVANPSDPSDASPMVQTTTDHQAAPLPEDAITPADLSKIPTLQDPLALPPGPLPAVGSPTGTGGNGGAGGTGSTPGGGAGTGGGGGNIRRSSIRHAEAADIDPTLIGIVANPLPSYPLDCHRNKQEGSVVINLLVDEQGRPIQWKVIHSDHPSFQASVEEVIANWRFKPVLVNGKRARTAFDMLFKFILRTSTKPAAPPPKG